MATFSNPDGTPATLTPEEQAQANLLIPTTPETGQLGNPYKPFQFHDETGNPVQMTPQDAAAARKQGGLVDPMLDLSQDEMVALATKSPEKFNIFAAVQARPDVQQNPEALGRAAMAWEAYKKQTGFDDLGISLKAAGSFIKELGSYAWTLLKNPKALATAITGNEKVADALSVFTPSMSIQGVKDLFSAHETEHAKSVRDVMEASYGTMLALKGLTELPQKPVRKFLERELTEPEAVQRLFYDLDQAKASQQLQVGKMPEGMEWFTSQRWEELKKHLEEKGAPIRPEVVAQRAQGDPLSAYLFAKGFGAATKAVPAPVSAAIERGVAVAGGLAEKAVGATVETGAQAAAKLLPPVAKVAPAVGAVKGAFEGGYPGAALGYAAGTVIKGKLLKAAASAENLASVGRQIAGSEAVKTPFAQLAKDVVYSAPGAAVEAGKGALFDIGFGELTAETPEEAKGLGIGLAFGLLGGGARTGTRVLSGQLIGPRSVGLKTEVKSRGFFPSLDTLSDQAYQGSPEGEQARLNAVRALLHSAFDNADTVYVPRPPEGAPDPAIPALMALRDPAGKPIFTEEQAKIWAGAEGLMSQDVGGKRLVFFRDIDAAPHEASGHGIEAALGESAMRQFDQIIQGDPKYAGPNWEAIAQYYASKFQVDGKHLWNPATTPWQDFLLQITGKGALEAKEKLIRDRIGEGPYTKEAANQLWNDWLANAPGDTPQAREMNTTRAILGDAEFNEAANRALAREIFAENAASSFEHGTAPDPALASRIARAVGSFVRALGGEPFAGRYSKQLGLPLSYDVVEAHRAASQGLARGVPIREIPQPTFRAGRIGATPQSPEERKRAADDALEIIQDAPDTPAPGRTLSLKTILGSIQQAIAGGHGVILDYEAAPGVPAAGAEVKKGGVLEKADRNIRRAEIEMARAPGAIRDLWQRLFTPTGVMETRDGNYIVQGYNPQVFAANAQALAAALSERPELMKLSPYPIDPATKSFTEAGWRQLHDDLYNRVIPNYANGRTGSGVPIEMPEDMVKAGYWKPQQGPGIPFDQRTSEFISMLFGVPTPKTLRLQNRPPLNIMGQKVRKATLGTALIEPKGKEPTLKQIEARVERWGAGGSRVEGERDQPDSG